MRIKMNAVLGMILTILMLGAANFTVQAQSINESRPTRLTSRVLSGTVSGNKVYYYALRAKRGSVVTVNAKAAWTNGASFSLSFRGMYGSDGGRKQCCQGDSYISLDHGSRGTKEIEKSFTVISDDEFLMAFSFNTPYLSYTIKFDGIKFDGEGDDDSDDMDAFEDDDTKTIIVPGKSGNNWVNTGISVRRGDVVTLSASGTVDVSAGWGVHNANGTRNFARMPNYPVNSRTRYGLAAKVVPTRGATIQNWSYGDAHRMVIARDGILWLTVNDDAPEDNSGEFKVNVRVQRGR